MFSRMLVAVDGSEHSRRAMSLAGQLAQRLGAEVIVVHVAEVHYSGAAVWSTESSAESAELVDTMVQRLEGAGVRARSQVREASHGHVAREIVAVAGEEGCELIVAGTRGHSKLKDLLLGGVTSSLLHRTTTPVLVVP